MNFDGVAAIQKMIIFLNWVRAFSGISLLISSGMKSIVGITLK